MELDLSAAARRRFLETANLLHHHPDTVTAARFMGGSDFFLREDKVQVKYEMLRAHFVDGLSPGTVAAAHGYSRAAFYLVADDFQQRGMLGLLDEKKGRRGPLKLTPEILAYISNTRKPGPVVAEEIERRFDVRVHRRTIERVRRR